MAKEVWRKDKMRERCGFLKGDAHDQKMKRKRLAKLRRKKLKIAPSSVMTFGMHKGKKMDEVPVEYLSFCLLSIKRLLPRVKKAMRASIRRGREATSP